MCPQGAGGWESVRTAKLPADTSGAAYHRVNRELPLDTGTTCDGWVAESIELELATRLLARGFTWKQEERVTGLTST